MPLRPVPTTTVSRLAMLLSLLVAASLVTITGPANATSPDAASGHVIGKAAGNPCQINVTMDELDDSRSPSTHGRGTVVCQRERGKIMLQMSILYRRTSRDVYDNITYSAPVLKKTCEHRISCVIGGVGGHTYDRRGWSGTYCTVLSWKYGNAKEYLRTETCRRLTQP